MVGKGGGPSDGEGVDQVEGGRDRVGPEDRVVGVVGPGGGVSDGEGVDQVEGGRDRVGPEDRVVGVVGGASDGGGCRPSGGW